MDALLGFGRPMLNALIGLVLGFLARLWLWTVRFRVVLHPNVDVACSQPWVLALWHGQLLPLLAHIRRRRTLALVSWSSDGTLLSWGMRWFGVHAERGSSSRGGRAGLRSMVQQLRNGCDGAFAVDGPRGPRGVAQPGALAAARDSDGWVVPYAAACSSTIRLRSWDRFQIPLPFSRVVIALGEPIVDVRAGVTTACLATRIDAATRLAQEVLDGVIPLQSSGQGGTPPPIHPRGSFRFLKNRPP